MLRAADGSVVCAALTTETAGLIGARELALMQGDAIFMNVARREIVNEAALYAHLAAHPRFFTGIDAWWVEPVRHGRFTMGHPFLNLPNVNSPRTRSTGAYRARARPSSRDAPEAARLARLQQPFSTMRMGVGSAEDSAPKLPCQYRPSRLASDLLRSPDISAREPADVARSREPS
jgi:D-isomer specific 2-hydroxyacid dehydrogenase, NAD binding domain